MSTGDTVAVRGTATLEPAGGPGDKIFPPTHAVEDKKPKPGAKYALDAILSGGKDGETAATEWLKANPAALDGWLAGVTTLSGADGLAAVKAHLGV